MTFQKGPVASVVGTGKIRSAGPVGVRAHRPIQDCRTDKLCRIYHVVLGQKLSWTVNELEVPAQLATCEQETMPSIVL